MRISTGLRIFTAVAATTSMTAGFIACSGSDEQDVIAEDAGRPETSVPDTSVPDTNKPDTSAADTGPKDSGPQYDAGPPTVLEAGAEYEGGIPCVLGGLAEEEINDEPDAANPLDPADASCVAPGCTRCGVIFKTELDADAGIDGGAEVEYLSFDLHPTAKSFYLQFAGDITMTVTVGNQGPFVINASSSPTLPFVRDATYFVKVTSNSGNRANWRVTLFETQ